MMALDLMAILVLIIISCSGFFVAFTLSFSDVDFSAPAAAYALFQMLMGFTPAAWDIWDNLQKDEAVAPEEIVFLSGTLRANTQSEGKDEPPPASKL